MNTIAPINTSDSITLSDPDSGNPFVDRRWGFLPAVTDSHCWVTRPWRAGNQVRLYVNGWDRAICDPDHGGKLTACTSGKKSPVASGGYFYLQSGTTADGSTVFTPRYQRGSLDPAERRFLGPVIDVITARIDASRLVTFNGYERSNNHDLSHWFLRMQWVAGYFDKHFINHCTGSRQLRHAWADCGLRQGTQWPKSADMRLAMCERVDNLIVQNPVMANDLRVAPGGTTADATADAPADAPAASQADGFDPDAMSHRDLVVLARKGHDADAAIKRQCEATELAVSQRAEAIQIADRLEAERDEAIKRADMLRPVATEVKHDGETVEILGVKLPAQPGDHGPTPADNYDLTAWRAAMEVNDFSLEANAAQVAKAIFDGDSVRLVGPPSVGKTSGIREVCSHTGAKFFLIPCGEGATDLSLIAERTIADDRSMQWVDGHVTKAVRWAIDNPEVLTIAVLDEVDHLPAEVQSLMHSVLEGGTLVVNPQETLTVPPNMRFTCTANTTGHGDMTGRHQAAKVSDTAFTSRWNATFTVTYLPAEAEARVLIGMGAPADLAESAVAAAADTRSESASVSQPIVLRQLIAWAKACGRGEDPRFAWGWRVLASMPEHDQHAMREITRVHMGW